MAIESIKIYYDINARNVDFEKIGRFFGSGSLEALADGDYVFARYKDSNVNEVYTLFSNVKKQDGSPAGANVTEVVDYLNEEFNKGIIKGLSSFNLLATSKVVTDSRLRVNDVIGITKYGSSTNEDVWTEIVSTNGQFTARRTLLNALGALTNNLTFQWERI